MHRTNLYAMTKGFAFGVLVLLGGYGLLFLWAVFGTQQQFYFSSYLRGIFLVALAIAGFTGGMSARWEGWKHGGLIGGAVAMATVVINVGLFPQLYSLYGMLNRLVVGALIGGAAAVCGVNFAFIKRKKSGGNKDKESLF